MNDDFLAENLDKSVEYAEYLAENLDKSVEYAEYLAENLDKTIEYEEYIAENLHDYEDRKRREKIIKNREKSIDSLLKD
jgi:hypothetical protein